MNRRTFIQATGISLLTPTLLAKEEKQYKTVKDFKLIETHFVKRWMKFTEHMPKEGQQILIYHFNECVGRDGFHAGTVIKINNKDGIAIRMKLDFCCGFWDKDPDIDKEAWSSSDYYSDEGKIALESKIWLQTEDAWDYKDQQKEMQQPQGVS